MWLERKFDKKDVFLFFLVLSVVYVFPMVHADYLYIDDQWRSLLLVDDLWRKQGRVFAELLYGALTFTSSMPNIFPLPLLLSMIAISFAMRSLVFYVYADVDLSKCLVVLPLLCSPFFLGSLTYQYDGPAMVLAVAAMVAAITLKPESVGLKVIVPAVLITVALGLYQLTIALFIGLCCLDVILDIHKKASWHMVCLTVILRGSQLVLGMVVYFFTAYLLSDTGRGKLLTFDSHWIHIVGSRLEIAVEKISLLNSRGVSWMFATLLFLAGAGGLIFVRRCLANEDRLLGKISILIVLLLVTAVLFLCIPGVMLFLDENRMDARNLMGFSVLLILLFYLAHEALSKIHPWAGICLVVPCLYMVSLSYMYGQVLNAKKEYEASLSNNIIYDLTSRIEFRDVVDFNFSAPDNESDSYWVPASEGTMELTPVIRYLLSSDNTILFPHRLQRMGINKVYWTKASINKLMAENKGKLIVDNKQYRIYLVGNEGLIQIKSHKVMVAP